MTFSYLHFNLPELFVQYIFNNIKFQIHLEPTLISWKWCFKRIGNNRHFKTVVSRRANRKRNAVYRYRTTSTVR